MLQVYPVIWTHHRACHSMHQSLVGQKADNRATVGGHVCSVDGAGVPGSGQTQGDRWSWPQERLCERDNHQQRRHAQKRSKEKKKLTIKNSYKMTSVLFHQLFIHWLNDKAGWTSSSSSLQLSDNAPPTFFFVLFVQVCYSCLLTRRMRHQTKLSKLYQ